MQLCVLIVKKAHLETLEKMVVNACIVLSTSFDQNNRDGQLKKYAPLLSTKGNLPSLQQKSDKMMTNCSC